jgi:hypothetical protein
MTAPLKNINFYPKLVLVKETRTPESKGKESRSHSKERDPIPIDSNGLLVVRHIFFTSFGTPRIRSRCPIKEGGASSTATSFCGSRKERRSRPLVSLMIP